MKLRRVAVLASLALAGIISTASPATAATVEEKLAVMSSWSQPTAASYDAWNSARQHQSDWASYGFDWSTDYCSTSPDQPLGFDFRLPCQRHDFGYRNYKAVGQFPANKSRIDDAFYRDLKAKCATYNAFVRPACTSLAWTYYQAVAAFGSVVVSDADLQRAADLKERGELAAAKARA
ncbi:phospholipase [Dactylosporangium aurantiacum]|uniref:Phospholipase n=1 Tax=Dactylosporangium aurantiacum TaxID=35754 RepID=A0A9Q9IEX0_9ACTN|nr:phospholipase [Dactylosporangium aurantiacum]MDG6102412.1 phospholipase [Dactylosporangium aurantiacum]UWZ53298.1 phospholipase [Dactylosporangium aurantiacum]